MEVNKEKKNRNPLFSKIIFLVLIAVVVYIVWLLSNGSYIYYSNPQSDGDSNSVIVCDGNSIDNAFFSYQGEISPVHRLKFLFSNDHFSEAYYSYDAYFNSREISEQASSWMHGKYNIYMRDVVGLYQEKLSPTFSVIDTRVLIRLYIAQGLLNSGTADFIFLDEGELVNIDAYKPDDFMTLYQRKGFSCNY